MEIRQITMRRALGLLIAVPMLLAGMGVGAAYAGDADGGMARTNGTRVTTDPAPVTIMGPGNNNATVTGVPFCSNINVNADCWTWEGTSGVFCPNAHFCLYTNEFPAAGGKVFSLYHCREYALQRWLDRGFVLNNNTGGAPGFLRGSNHATLPGGTIPANTGKGYNFFPVWFVKAC